MSIRVGSTKPYLLEIERMKQLGMPSPRPLAFGDSLAGQVSWSFGGVRMAEPIKVAVMGTENNDSFLCPPDIFVKSALKLGGEPIFSPPPFAVPCTDGILIVYTLRRSSSEGTDVHGGYILVPKEELEENRDAPISFHWKRAQKPANTRTMLKKLGFCETRSAYLN